MAKIEVCPEKRKKIDRRAKKKGGVEYDGVMVSLTPEDVRGVVTVKSMFEWAGIEDTVIEFSNSSILSVDRKRLDDFFPWYMRQANGLFTGDQL